MAMMPALCARAKAPAAAASESVSSSGTSNERAWLEGMRGCRANIKKYGDIFVLAWAEQLYPSTIHGKQASQVSGCAVVAAYLRNARLIV